MGDVGVSRLEGQLQAGADGLACRRAVILSFTGGLSPRQENLAKLLSAQNIAVSLIVWDRGEGRAPAWSNYPWPIRVVAVPAPVASARMLLSLGPYLRGMARALDADAKDNNSPRLIVATYPFHLLLPRRRQDHWLYDVAEYFPQDLSRYFRGLAPLFERPLSAIEDFLARGIRAALVVDSKDNWLKRRFTRRRIPAMTIPNVPALADDASQAAIGDLDPQYRGRKVIAYAGGLIQVQGVPLLIEAFPRVVKRHPQALLMLVGSSENPKLIPDAIEAAGIKENVLVLPPMSYAAMQAHLCHAQIGMALFQPENRLPLYGSANSRKIFTYMQAGLAIITAGHSELGRAVREAGCGVLIDATDPIAVGDAINALLERPEELAKYRRHARHAFEATWNWEKVADRVLDFLYSAGVLAKNMEAD